MTALPVFGHKNGIIKRAKNIFSRKVNCRGESGHVAMVSWHDCLHIGNKRLGRE